jgi:hypothetical protein
MIRLLAGAAILLAVSASVLSCSLSSFFNGADDTDRIAEGEPFFVAVVCSAQELDIGGGSFMANPSVETVSILATTTAGVRIGSGDLEKSVGYWGGTIAVSQVGPAIFTATAKGPDGLALYRGEVSQTITGRQDRVAITVQKTESMSPVGAGFFSWGAFAYVVGGYDPGGNLRKEVWRCAVASDGAVSQWTRMGDLPDGIALAACVATGNRAYVIGGIGADGPSDRILYTIINADGSLGFSARTWDTNVLRLPAARAAAALLVLRGRVFLFGGREAAGPSPSVISARLWNDGQVGHWYDAPDPLPLAGEGYTASVFGNGVWVAGADAAFAYRAAISDNGLPAAWTAEALPGAPIAYPASVATADGLLIFGGIDGSAGSYGQTRLWDGNSWTLSAGLGAWGGRGIVIANTAFAPFSVRGNENPLLASIPIGTARADAPLVSPGSGIVPANTTLRIIAYPGDTVRYTVAAYGDTPEAPTENSPIWLATKSISASASYAFRAFRAQAEPSEIVYESYRSVASNFFVLTQDSIPASAAAGVFAPYSLSETYSDGTSSPLASVWRKIVVPSRRAVVLSWADADDDPERYSARVGFSLFENDLCTPVLLSSGYGFYKASGGLTHPARMTLGAGTYYLLAESTDGGIGGTFGVSLQMSE